LIDIKNTGIQFNPDDPHFKEAISSVPRLLSLIDRNPVSKSFGSFDRSYWLEKSIDFPSANLQFGVLALSLLYKINYNNSFYYQNPIILKWIEAAINFWGKCQHNDGSFDEFYPNERGWGAPTGFTCYAISYSLYLLGDSLPESLILKTKNSLIQGIKFLNKYTGDKMLANHHAMSILAINALSNVVDDKIILSDLENKILVLKSMHCDEGWSKEYDGPDLGYLTATISFLSKSQRINKIKEIESIIDSSIEFCSYFIQPDGGFGGVLGSRNTVHIYPDGFMINAPNNPLANRISQFCEETITNNNLALPIRMPDRYLGYRIVEFLETALTKAVDFPDYDSSIILPFERSSFVKEFEIAGMFIKKQNSKYLIINLLKGGVFKLFDIDKKKLIYSDSGITLKLSNGRVLTSNWIDNNYKFKINNNFIKIDGFLNEVVNPYQHTFGMIIFRLIQKSIGQISFIAYYTKILIKKLFISGSKRSTIKFSRTFNISENQISIIDNINGKLFKKTEKLFIGGEFHQRYVPQSRYFLDSEFNIDFGEIDKEDIGHAITKECFSLERKFDL